MKKRLNTVATGGEVTIVCDDSCANLVCQESDWVIDFGALFHVTSRDDCLLSTLKVIMAI